MRYSLDGGARLTLIAGLVTIGAALVLALTASPARTSPPAGAVVYDNIPSPQPSNVPSLGYEATSTSEFGAQLVLAGGQRKNPRVTVLMSSWACKSGTWQANCVTNPGSTFTHPVTLKVYAVGAGNAPGSLITSKTQTFTMPYRPTMDDGTHCSGTSAGQWWDGKACVNGKAFPIGFDLTGTTLPDKVIVTVAYNTSDHGAAPLGTATPCHATPQGCPYDSLNVGVAPGPTVGDAAPTAADVYLSSTWGGAYCDNGASGTGSLRLDAGCWTGQQPAFEVAASGRGGAPHWHPRRHAVGHGPKSGRHGARFPWLRHP